MNDETWEIIMQARGEASDKAEVDLQLHIAICGYDNEKYEELYEIYKKAYHRVHLYWPSERYIVTEEGQTIWVPMFEEEP